MEIVKGNTRTTIGSSTSRITLAVVLPLILLTSCMVGPNFHWPDSSVEGHWVQKRGVSEHPYGVAERYWWRTFDDPASNRLIETAYARNLSLQAAGVRILEARAALNAAVGNLFPQQQGAGGGINYYRLGNSSRAGPSLADSPVSDIVSRILDNRDIQFGPNIATDRVLLSAAWELDFWGKFRREIQSQKASWLASVAAYDDALVTLIGDVANAYVNLRTFEARLQVLRNSIAAQEGSLRIANARFNAGETSELDALQSNTELSKIKAEVPEFENGIAQSRNALSVLLGVTPADIARYLGNSGRIPTPPSRIAAGIPRDLLRRRPDVRLAGLQAASQSPKIGVAVSNLLPSFSLTGSFGSSGSNIASSSLSDIFTWQSKAVQVGGSFVVPILNYGRIVNQIRIEDARFQGAVLNYQNTVLKAQSEVENGLSAFTSARRAAGLLDEASGTAGRSADLALIRYQQGQNDYSVVLTAQQQQLQIDNSAVSAHGSAILALISVYRALGGGWQMREGGDVISPEVKTEMARRTNWGKMLEPGGHLPDVAPPSSGALKKEEAPQ
jgi:NodT family efflux transporter outer membrane factor (OMF) lipoprotein